MKSKMKDVISTILSDYIPKTQYLRTVRVVRKNPLTLKGRFLVHDSAHLAHPIEHVAISEIAICVNQFERVAVAHMVESGYVEEWGKVNFIEWNPSKLGDEGLVIVHEAVTFMDVILPGKEFEGILRLEEERKSKRGNHHVRFSFEFDDRKHFGEVRICFIPGKSLE